MKLINNKVEEIIQNPGIEGVYEIIANTARICYQSDASKSKLTPKEFVDNLLKRGHTRPLEFGTVYLKMPIEKSSSLNSDTAYKSVKYVMNPYTKIKFAGLPGDDNSVMYITTNMRVIMQGDYQSDYEAWKNGYNKNWLSDLEEYWCEPTSLHHKRYTFDLILSRGASDDLRTHITLSSMCESTRYCNYSNGKYGKQLTGIKPYWIDFGTDEDINVVSNEYGAIDINNIDALNEDDYDFVTSMAVEEQEYMRNAEKGLQPQQLKRLFPLWGKCELRLCGFEDSWNNFRWRRLDEHADPECKIIAEKIDEIRKIS